MAKKVYVITGPIGSGKSTAIEYLKNKGFKNVKFAGETKWKRKIFVYKRA